MSRALCGGKLGDKELHEFFLRLIGTLRIENHSSGLDGFRIPSLRRTRPMTMGWREALTAREHLGVFLILSAVITQCSEIFCCIEIAISVFQL